MNRQLEMIGCDLHTELRLVKDDFSKVKIDKAHESVIRLRDLAIRRGVLHKGDPSSLTEIVARVLRLNVPPTPPLSLYPKATPPDSYRTSMALEAWLCLQVEETLLKKSVIG